MPITTRCSCGARFAAPDKLAGRAVKCPKCSQPVRVQAADQPAAGVATDPIGVKCQCGKALKVPGKFAGKSVKCPACGKALAVPRPNRASAAAGERSTEDSVAGLLDEADLNLSKTGRRCPECREDMQLDDIICIQCGYNTETGKKVKVKKARKGAEDWQCPLPDAAARGPTRPKPSSRSPSSSIRRLPWRIDGRRHRGVHGLSADAIGPEAGNRRIPDRTDRIRRYVLGGFGVLVTVPCAVAAKLVETGKPAGRILSIVMGFVTLLGVPVAHLLLGVLVLRLFALPDAYAILALRVFGVGDQRTTRPCRPDWQSGVRNESADRYGLAIRPTKESADNAGIAIRPTFSAAVSGWPARRKRSLPQVPPPTCCGAAHSRVSSGSCGSGYPAEEGDATPSTSTSLTKIGWSTCPCSSSSCRSFAVKWTPFDSRSRCASRSPRSIR